MVYFVVGHRCCREVGWKFFRNSFVIEVWTACLCLLLRLFGAVADRGTLTALYAGQALGWTIGVRVAFGWLRKQLLSIPVGR